MDKTKVMQAFSKVFEICEKRGYWMDNFGRWVEGNSSHYTVQYPNTVSMIKSIANEENIALF